MPASRCASSAGLVAALTLAFAACGGDDDTAAGDATDQRNTAAATTGGGDVGRGNSQAGEIVFVNEGCGGCHSLKDAGVTGSIDEEGGLGPDLDEAMASYEVIVDAVTNGQGVMPAFQGDISPQDIQDVAAYVSSVAGK